jgi:AGCS family alanine or glycine:cation symporter
VSIFGVTYSYSAVIAGMFVTISSALVIIGGIKRIAKVSMVVVPFMAVTYVLVCLTVLFCNASRIPEAFMTIFQAAFNPQAFTGGAVGTIFIAMQKGIARGIFSNEAGLGSAPIAAAAAKTDNPVQQGLVCMTGTFIDTIVICTMTGLAIVLSGTWDPALGLAGVDITIAAFSKLLWFLPNGSAIASLFLMLSLSFFAFTTILGWNYYSEKCLEYIVGSNRIGWLKAFRILYVMIVFVGPYLTVSLVWNIADIFNGLMALPNLIALTLLMPVVIRESRDL